MYKIKVIALLVFCQSLQAQSPTETIAIEWKEPTTILIGDEERLTPNFTDAVHISDFDFLPCLSVKLPGNATNIELNQVIYENLDSNELGIFPEEYDYGSMQVLPQSYSNNGITQVTIAPFRKNGEQIQKALSFSIKYELNDDIKTTTNTLIDTINQSVLAEGDWYRMEVDRNGIFKIDRAFLLNLGINPSNIDPRNIAIYGNGGKMLPQPNSTPRAYDLTENHIYVSGEGDGSFGNSDYVLFYGESTNDIYFNSSSNLFEHQINYYDDKSYYYLTIKNEPGLRISEQASSSNSSIDLYSFTEYKFHEKSFNNLILSGRSWLGESYEFFDEHDFNFSLDGVVDEVTLRINVAAQSKLVSTQFLPTINGQPQNRITVPNSTNNAYGIKGREVTETYNLSKNDVGNSLSIDITFNENGNVEALGFIDQLNVQYEKELKLYGSQTSFRSGANLSSAVTYYIKDANDSYVVWDVTNPLAPKNQNYILSGDTIIFTAEGGLVREFVVFKGSSFSAASIKGTVENQNLHGIVTVPELLIVTSSRFIDEANELASFKESVENISTEVVTLSEVYNEFSSGKQDVVAIRDFAKMLYDRSSDNNRFQYLLLFGDASYDYKNILDDNTNRVPTYQARQSLHNVTTYASDDFYGFLEDAEGEWRENGLGNHTLDIGIGRFPVNTTEEAENIVDKIKHYVSNADAQGKWRTSLAFLADDGDGVTHMEDADDLVDIIEPLFPMYNSSKLYLDIFEQESSASGETSPKAQQAVNENIEQGVLIMNYTGHGGETVLGQEELITLSQIDSWENFERLPLFVTATCEFGRFDDPARQSGAERLINKGNGGAISLLTTTRPVYANSNATLNRAFFRNIFEPLEDGSMPRLGDIIKATKNESLIGVNNRNFTLLGDPSLRLAYPENNIVVTSINGDTSSTTDTINALSSVVLEGQIQNQNDELLNNFDGVLNITVYDKKNNLITLGNEGSRFSYSEYNSILYEGTATVSNGAFSVEFVVPKDIAYNYDFGKISLYAANGVDTDAGGVVDDLVIGGSNVNVQEDNTPPMISLYMDDYSFVNGGTTSEDPLFIASLYDDNGINTAANGIGHEITATIDGNSEDKFILNNFYTAKIDNYREGEVLYQFNGMSEGKHDVTLKAWDTHNNSAEKTLDFYVGQEPEIGAYPNPFQNNTSIYIDHTRAKDDMDLKVEIMNPVGQPIYTQNFSFNGSSSNFELLSWNGNNDFGETLPGGVYFFKVSIRYLNDGAEFSKIGRLVYQNR